MAVFRKKQKYFETPVQRSSLNLAEVHVTAFKDKQKFRRQSAAWL
jgi:hypothetical protein